MARRRAREIGDRQANAMVMWFRLQRLLRSLVLFVLGVALLGGLGGYVLALVGPEDGVARKFAEAHHLLPGLEAARRRAAEDVQAARKGYERGDVFDLARAEEHLARARVLDPRDGRIAADHSLMLAAHADALLRWKQDLEIEAQDPSTKPDRARELKELAAAKILQSQKLAQSADEAMKEAVRLAPEAMETIRASAELRHLAKDEPGARKALERAKAQGDDPWSVQIEAAAAAPDPQSATRTALFESATLIKKAIAVSPDFAQAHVQLARILIAQGERDTAKKELDGVIAKLQVHSEANRLLARIALMNR
jgi:hypothetical protein